MANLSIRDKRIAALVAKKDKLFSAMNKTDSDMFEYYAMLNVDRIDGIIHKYKRCGYPLCKYYSPKVETMTCPTPIEGTACQG